MDQGGNNGGSPPFRGTNIGRIFEGTIMSAQGAYGKKGQRAMGKKLGAKRERKSKMPMAIDGDTLEKSTRRGKREARGCVNEEGAGRKKKNQGGKIGAMIGLR